MEPISSNPLSALTPLSTLGPTMIDLDKVSWNVKEIELGIPAPLTPYPLRVPYLFVKSD